MARPLPSLLTTLSTGVLAGSLTLVACSGDSSVAPVSTSPRPTTSAGLGGLGRSVRPFQRFTSCQELLTYVRTEALGGQDIDRLFLWSGAVLHAPHRAMSAQRGIKPEGVFVAYFSYGSPSTRYKLYAGRRIVEVDGRPTPDLDAFIAAVRGRPDRSAVRLKTVTWNGSVDVTTLKLDTQYWPTRELRRTDTGWVSRTID